MILDSVLHGQLAVVLVMGSGRWGWVVPDGLWEIIERTMSWLTGYRRLNHRYERHPRNYLAFLGLAAALCCYKRFLKLTM